MRPILRLVPLGVVPVALLAAGCTGSSSGGAPGRVQVVAAFYPLAFAAERLGGAAVDVHDLTPPGVEPHDLELTADDLEAIAQADVVVFLGGGFQPAIEDAVDAEATGEVVDVAQGFPMRDGDPHVWLDPALYGRIVERVRDALGDAGVDTSATGEALVGAVADLDHRFAEGLAGCRGRLIVTNHAAFGYLAEAYGLRQESISGLSPEAEPDPAHLAELAARIRSAGATTVFTESLVPPDVAQTLAAEAGVGVAVLDPLEGLTQARIDDGEDYLSVMGENLQILREGLGC